jgi:hypothetical protein
LDLGVACVQVAQSRQSVVPLLAGVGRFMACRISLGAERTRESAPSIRGRPGGFIWICGTGCALVGVYLL